MKLTPRQRVALNHPCVEGRGYDHARYHRRNGVWQTVFTLDLKPPRVPENSSALGAAVHEGEWAGEWQARACKVTFQPIGEWDPSDLPHVKRILQRLVGRVGNGRTRLEKGVEKAPKVVIHVFKPATREEVDAARKKIEKDEWPARSGMSKVTGG